MKILMSSFMRKCCFEKEGGRMKEFMSGINSSFHKSSGQLAPIGDETRTGKLMDKNF